MMMPANFSVVAENEMTYVVGGGVIEAIGSVTAPIWTLLMSRLSTPTW